MNEFGLCNQISDFTWSPSLDSASDGIAPSDQVEETANRLSNQFFPLLPGRQEKGSPRRVKPAQWSIKGQLSSS